MLNRRRFLKTALASAGALSSSIPLRPLYADPTGVDVVVIGAGLAGLQSALDLQNRGMNVVVLEANSRIGGRVWTLNDLPGKPEAGGSQVGGNYTVFRETAKKLGVAFSPGSKMANGMRLIIDDTVVNSSAWQSASVNKLNADEKATQPSWLLWKYLARAPLLASPAQWTAPDYARFDIPLESFLQSLNASPQALQLIPCDLNGDIRELSTLDAMRRLAIVGQSRGADFVNGGTQVMTDAMAKALQQPVKTGFAVTTIDDQKNSVQIQCQNGAQFIARKVVCSIPFSAARSIHWSAGLSAAKTELIKRLRYHPVSHVFLQPKNRFWEVDAQQLNLWTDLPMGRLFAQLDAKGDVSHFRFWLNGMDAQQFDAMPREQAQQQLLKMLAQYWPASKNNLQVLRYISWEQDIYHQGAFSWYAAGDVTRYALAANTIEGNVHFAGEHTEHGFSGMEAACLSGKRCAAEIVI